MWIKNTTDSYFECRDVPIVENASFCTPDPWLLPFNIASISGSDLTRISKEITVYCKKYHLAGITTNANNHFIAIISWYEKTYYYDGMTTTKEKRFIPFTESQLQNKIGSYAYFIVSEFTH